MTDTPENAAIIYYDSLIDLRDPICQLYGNEFFLMNCIITIEYIKGHEPQFFHTGLLELSDEDNCSYNIHQEKYRIFFYQRSKINKDLNLFFKSKIERTLNEQYIVLSDSQLKINQSLQEFRSSLTLDQEASSTKALKMNQIVSSENTVKTLKLIECFYMTCLKKEDSMISSLGKTMLKFSPEGYEPKFAVLIDKSFERDGVLNLLKATIKLEEAIKKTTEENKSGCLTPQYQQPDHFWTKPDYLNKGWLLGAANNPVLASAGIAR